MHSILYALNIGTLATWLSVCGAGSIALVVKSGDVDFEAMQVPKVEDSEGPDLDFDLEQMAAGSAAPTDPEVPAAEKEESPEEEVLRELLEAVPELPEIADVVPLPEIPELPQLPKPEPPRDPPVRASIKPASPPRPTSRGSEKPASSSNSGSGTGKGSGTSTGNGSGEVGAARWAGGRMPAPNYPSEARRNGHEGRVVVLFSVDEQGNVVSAKVTGPCPHPALNEEALRAVRRWKFQPGARASLQRPIIFKLN
jgi:protein TonB